MSWANGRSHTVHVRLWSTCLYTYCDKNLNIRGSTNKKQYNFSPFCSLDKTYDAVSCCPRFYGKLLQSLMDCDEDTVDRIRTSMVSRLGPEMSMLIQLLQNKPCPSTAVAAAAAIPTGVEGRGSWRWSMGPHMYKIQPNLRNRDAANNFGKRRSASDNS